MELTMTNNFGFCELNENEMMMVNGGGLLASIGIAIVGTVITWVIYEVANSICEHFTGKTVGKAIADLIS